MNYRNYYAKLLNLDTKEGTTSVCENCFSVCQLEVYPIQGSKDYDDKYNIIENLIVLCDKCRDYHLGKERMRFFLYESHRQFIENRNINYDKDLVEKLKRGLNLKD